MEANEPQQSDCPGCRVLAEKVARLEEQVERLTKILEEKERAGKRQAAPFRKAKKKVARKPGRKPGDAYGEQARRSVPDRIDEVYQAELPECCPHCGADEVWGHAVRQQYQVDIPRRPIVRQFDVHIGECLCCGKRVQGRHELQTSDALGAAAL